MPGGIEAAKSSNDDLKVESSLRCKTGHINRATPVLMHERPSEKQLTDEGIVKPVSDASVVNLKSWVTHIDIAITNLNDCLFIADSSTAVDSMVHAKCKALIYEMEVAAGVIEKYIELNMEADADRVIVNVYVLVHTSLKLCTRIRELAKTELRT